MQGFDLSTAQDIRLGSTSVSAIYLCDKLIWPSTPPVPPHDYSQDYFTIVSEADNNTIILTAPIDDPINPTGYNYSLVNLLYSTDNGSTWIDWSTSSAVRNISLNNEDKVLFKGLNDELFHEDLHYYYTIINGSKAHRVEGNIASLMFGDNYIWQTQPDVLSDGGFRSLLSRDTTLTSAENLILPFTRLVNNMYNSMFYGCTSLTVAPKIISAIVDYKSYMYMFSHCTSLVNVPRIEANLGWVGSSYGYTYDGMFENCSSLNYLECMLDPTNTGAFSNWLNGVAATGTFKKSSSYTWSSSLIPSGWTVTNV